MAIRGPSGRPEPTPGLRTEGGPGGAPGLTSASPLGRLVRFLEEAPGGKKLGVAQTPQEAKKLLGELLALLAAAGFPVPKTGNPEQQLQSQLKQFQQANNLPVTGRLDDATMKALGDKGLLPGRHEAITDQGTNRADGGRLQDRVELGLPRPALGGDPRLGGERSALAPAPRAGDGSAPGQTTRSVETESAAARVAHGKSDVEVDLKSMMQSLKAAGFVGVGKGKEQLQDAVKKLQRVDGLPTTGKLDAQTADALLRRGVLDPQTAQALKEQDPAWVAQQAQQAQQAQHQEAATSTSSTNGTNTEAQPQAQANVAGGGEHLPAGVDGHQAPVDLRAGGDGDGDRGVDDGQGNAYAGDENHEDEDRGGANVDGDDDQGGHWSVPSLPVQIAAALTDIVRDDDGHGPATYGWQLVLHRPGVYARKQPAEEVLKLTVQSAGPFDPVWRQALEALNQRIARYAGLRAPNEDTNDDDGDDAENAAPLPFSAIETALQRARYRS